MPTYDYRCDACDHEFELFQQMSDPVKRKCPECGALKLQRLIGTGAGVIFKGSGFYETDYRSESYKKAAEAESKSKNAKSDAKPDAKPNAKPDAKPDAPAKKDAPAKADAQNSRKGTKNDG